MPYAEYTLNKDKICSHCGRKLKLLDTEDNSGRPVKWRGCDNCNKLENGVSRDIFKIANILLFKYQEKPYSFIDTPEGLFYNKIKTLEDAEKTKDDSIINYCYSQLGGLCGNIERILYLKEELKKDKQ